MAGRRRAALGRDVPGVPTAEGCRFALVVSRFNPEITEGLLRGARQALAEARVREDDIEIIRVPGAFEIPMAALTAARTSRFDAVVCLGCLIKGETMHFEHIAAAASQGIMNAAQTAGVPMALGVLTTLTEEQAEARSADGPDNKGLEAARAAVEMATLYRRLGKGASA